MSPVTALDRDLERLVDLAVKPDKIAGDFVFTEGPVWDARTRSLFFSDIQGDTLYRWSETEGLQPFRRPSGQSNGNTMDAQGRLLTCEHVNRRVTRTLPDGKIEVVADSYDGKRLNSPNDIVCAPSGDIYFTDPPYGLRQPDGSIAGQELPFFGVYRVTPEGELILVLHDFVRPNGIVVSSDGARLYVDDTERQHVRVFDITPSGGLRNGQEFMELAHPGTNPRPDGMKLDSEGNLYVATNTREGIWVYNPQGRLLGFIGVDEPPANLAWGGPDWRTLYVTARTSVYRLPMLVAGQPVAAWNAGT